MLIQVENAADYAIGSKHTVEDGVMIVAAHVDETHIVVTVDGQLEMAEPAVAPEPEPVAEPAPEAPVEDVPAP